MEIKMMNGVPHELMKEYILLKSDFQFNGKLCSPAVEEAVRCSAQILLHTIRYWQNTEQKKTLQTEVWRADSSS